jgi:maltooligosyltrehalose trehalohydrolase
VSDYSRRTLGACLAEDRQCIFTVWAPAAASVDAHVVEPGDKLHPMSRCEKGYWQLQLEDVSPGTLYFYRLNGSEERPDPASTSQPRGVHGPSAVTPISFDWHDGAWHGLPLEQYVLYELHVGTFTREGTFEVIIPRLTELRDLGVTALELMPAAQFPGTRNWGYDGVYPFAPQQSYGGCDGLRRLVDACHSAGMAVVLDVVYNHLGPEGNYLARFGPYFTDRYKTPWGLAVNYDDAYSDEVRRFFLENAAYWVRDFHFDALRLDAIHAIYDRSAIPFLQELGEAVHRLGANLGRRIYAIAESSLNDSRILRSVEQGGYGLDAQWSDDLHHCLRVLLTGERSGYYQDFGDFDQLVKAYREGYVYTGEYSPYRGRRHGNRSRDIPAYRFIVCSQNHDQVGNRMHGDRLSASLGLEALKLAAGAVLLSPFIPLLFMGEEYGETAPFAYFVSHSDPGLIEAVRRGRRDEFAAFEWQGEVPDPQDVQTFLNSRLDWGLRQQGKHRVLLQFYRELLELRRSHPALAMLSKDHLEVIGDAAGKVLVLRRWCESEEACVAMNFGTETATVLLPAGRWSKLLDSKDQRWLGPGSQTAESVESASGQVISIEAAGLLLLGRKEGRTLSVALGRESDET